MYHETWRRTSRVSEYASGLASWTVDHGIYNHAPSFVGWESWKVDGEWSLIPEDAFSHAEVVDFNVQNENVLEMWWRERERVIRFALEAQLLNDATCKFCTFLFVGFILADVL